MRMVVDVGGVLVHQGFLTPEAQAALVDQVRQVVKAAPLGRYETQRGHTMSVAMSAAGTHGWVSDRRGYRYQDTHPQGSPWPPIPPIALDVWRRLSQVARDPQCCLVNFYDGAAKMGMHQDRDEADFTMPVISISLGEAALFRIGGTERGGKTQSIWLNSGDVAVMAGAARLAYHGIDRLRPGSSTLLPKGGRINLTLRVVD